MKLRIIGHPAQRMAERRITREDIEHALANYHTRSERGGPRPSITYIGPGTDGRDLKVWVLPPGLGDASTTITVKSVAWKDEEDRT